MVARVGGKSVVVLSGRSEASWLDFFIGQGSRCSRSKFPVFVEKPQELPLTSLQPPREWKNRTQLEKFYTSDEAIPLEVESTKKISMHVE